MADYGLKTLLSTLDETTPGNAEVANKLTAALREVKYFLKQYLAQAHNDNGTIKDGSIATAGMVATGVLTGTQIANLSIATANIADLAVTEGKINTGAVTSGKLGASAVIAGKIAANAVTETTILDGSVTAGKLGALSVINTKLGPLAVEEAKINTGAVTNGKIGTAAVTGDKLFNTSPTPPGLTGAAGEPLIAVAAGAVSGMLPIRGVIRATVDTGTLLFTFNATGTGGAATNYLRLGRVAATTVGGGASGVTTHQDLSPWTVLTGHSTLVGKNVEKLTLSAGVYIVWAEGVAYAAGSHRIRLQQYNTGTTDWEEISGAQGSCALAPAGTQTTSSLMCILAPDTSTMYKVVHYTALADANGLGYPTSDGVDELYSTFSVLKLQ